jgi:SHS2 domain-containing protein
VRYALPQPFEDLEHTADAGVSVAGATAEEALARLVLAYAALVAGGGAVTAERHERIAVPGTERTGAAIDLLRELHYRFTTERLLPAWCEPVRIDGGGAEVLVGLGRWDPERHAEGLDIKAVTRHAARFEETADGWRAEAVFDI